MSVALDVRREVRESAIDKEPLTHRRILALARARGREGITADEAAGVLTINLLTARPAITKLHQAGFLVEQGSRRRSITGRPQTVYVTKEHANHGEGSDGEGARI